MLSIRPTSSSTSESKTSINLLPCRIHHTGPANATKAHWSPSPSTSETKTAYFRGRKLVGKDVKLPAGYTGCILETTDEIVKDEEEEEEEGGVKTTVFQTLAEFRDITVWGHEQVPAEEGVLRGVEEWVGWAGRIHGWQEEVEGKA